MSLFGGLFDMQAKGKRNELDNNLDQIEIKLNSNCV